MVKDLTNRILEHAVTPTVYNKPPVVLTGNGARMPMVYLMGEIPSYIKFSNINTLDFYNDIQGCKELIKKCHCHSGITTMANKPVSIVRVVAGNEHNLCNVLTELELVDPIMGPHYDFDTVNLTLSDINDYDMFIGYYNGELIIGTI